MRPLWTSVGLIVAFGANGCLDAPKDEAPASAAGSAKATGYMFAPDEEKKRADAQEADAAPNRQKAPEAAAPSAGADFGAGGLGLSGIGEAGGGRGDGIGLGGVGTIGHGAGTGTGQGFGNGSGRMGAPPRSLKESAVLNSAPNMAAKSRPSSPPGNRYGVQGPPAMEEPIPPPPQVETAIDANGRFATTYRPGAGHLAAFDSAVAAGLLPAAEREIVSDVGARYATAIDPPTTGALAFRTDLERAKMAPGGGQVHVRLALTSTETAPKERPHLSVVVVLDVSGSMRGQLIQAARDSATTLVDKLQPGDDFSLITFSTEAGVLVPLGKVGPRRDAIKKTISEIKEGGGTNISEGLRLGYEQAQDKKVPDDAVRVVMLLSDGRANGGITDRRVLAGMANQAFQDGIQTSSFGLGTDYDGPLMSQIANDGAGGYYYLKDTTQIAAALTTELDKRLDPVATALEVRVRLKPGVELLNVYGSRKLTKTEAATVRTIEVAQDKQTEKIGIKANRQNDVEGGMRFFIPAFARNDNHAILLKLRLPEGVGAKEVALIELKYKDRVTKKNVADEFPLKVEYANSDAESARSIDPVVARTVQGFLAGESLMQAAQLVAQGNTQNAVDLLGEREGLLHHAAATLGEPLFVDDAKRLARLRVHAAGKSKVKDPLVLAMMMETAGNAHMR